MVVLQGKRGNGQGDGSPSAERRQWPSWSSVLRELSFKNEHRMHTDTCQKKNESLETRHQAFGGGEGEQRNVHECEEGESKQTLSTQSRNKTT